MPTQVFTASHIHDGKDFLAQGSGLVIQEDRVIKILLPQEVPADAIHIEGLICPAFINAHCHLELSHLAGKIDRHTGFTAFAQQIVTKRKTATDDEIQDAILAALDESYRNGVQFIGDISNSIVTLAHKKQHKVRTHTFIEVFGMDPSRSKEIADEALKNLEVFHKAGLSAGITPHATYSLHPRLWKLIHPLLQSPISIHHQESKEEDEYFRQHKGPFIEWFSKIEPDIANLVTKQSPTEYLLQQIAHDMHTLFIHNVDTTLEEIALASRIVNRFWVTCPQANLYIQNRIPSNYVDLIQAEENICIGTDSLASNDRLSIWSEICVLNSMCGISLHLLLRYATYNGAQALQQKELGHFSVGNESRVIHIQKYKREDGSLNPDAEIRYL